MSTLSKPGESPKDALINCLMQQLSEYELLQSMYTENDEIILTNPTILMEINNFISGAYDYIPPHLDFNINLYIEKMKLELCINLPSFYPNEEPDVYVRCNQMNRQQETYLNNKLINFIKENHHGDVFLYTIVSWLQENAKSLTQSFTIEPKIVEEEMAQVNDRFVRLWIYSHHIYNKKKRDEIVQKAKEMSLTGFCLPGKPGIVCIEGTDNNCQQWWKEIKSMSWKKICIRKTETFDYNEQEKEQKFECFQEIYFQNNVLRLSKHLDMSGFLKFIKDHGLEQSFNDFFGLCKEV